MKTWKWVALVCSGGMLLQLGACASVLMQSVGEQILTTVLVAIVQALVGSQTTA